MAAHPQSPLPIGAMAMRDRRTSDRKDSNARHPLIQIHVHDHDHYFWPLDRIAQMGRRAAASIGTIGMDPRVIEATAADQTIVSLVKTGQR